MATVMQTSGLALMATAPAVAVEIEQPSFEQIEEALRTVVDRLGQLAAEQVRLKGPIEKRWLKALRQFHGRYDAETEQALADANKSRAFIKLTRKKTNSWKGRLESLIFPTDDRNYGIQPTPVPSLTSEAREVVEKAIAMVEEANAANAAAAQAAAQGDEAAAQQQAGTAAEIAGQADEIAKRAKVIAEEIKEAKKRAEAMQAVMDDQLIECQYAAEGRDAILDLVRLGTGIMKGPLATEKTRGRWVPVVKIDNGVEVSTFEYQREADPAPIFRRVNPWSYFPDMSALKKGEEEFEFERHLWSKKDLRALVRDRGFNADAVRRIIDRASSNRTVSSEEGLTYLADLRSINGTGETIRGRFVGWEYHGPLEAEEIVTMLQAMGQFEDAQYYKDNADPLGELKVIAFFCEGELLKIAPEYPLDSQESLYSVVPFEADEASIFGYGIPDIMADSQAAANAAWRMAMDNGGLSTGPQVLIDRDVVEPANGRWEITARKVWYKKKAAAAGTAFELFDVPNKVSEIMAIVTTARAFADDETQLPVQSEGEITDNPNVTATASNIMALGFNVTFRSVVKAWDDGMTAPSMRRLYDWNMQHSKRSDIKGDMTIDARGTSVLLVKEIQSQMLMLIAQNHTTHPVLGMMLKPYDTYRKMLQSLMIPPDEIMATKEEYDDAIARQAEQPQQSPQEITAQAALERAKIETEASLKIADIQRETELIKLAEQRNMKLDELQALLAGREMEIASKERMFAGELGAEERNAARAAAAGQQPTGSGGFISAGTEPRP